MHVRQNPDHPGAEGDNKSPANGPRHAATAAPKSRKGTGNRRIRLMPRSVRAKIVSLLMVPVVSLMALWAFATVTTAQNVSELDRLKQIDATLVAPVGDFVAAVQDERSAAARAQAAPDAGRQPGAA